MTLISAKIYGQESPNIIFILADDQGWNGTSVAMDPNNSESKSDFYETPNLERLAEMGMRFSQAYAPSPKCAPSRMSIITGQTTARNHFTNTSSVAAAGKILKEPSSNIAISSSNLTFPEYLKSIAGLDYKSAHFGKWHLGNDDPKLHGFDESDGANSNNDGTGGSPLNDDPKKIFSITQSGVDFMNAAISDNQPFYLQLSHYAVHTDIESTQSAQNKYEAKIAGTKHENVPYAAMTEDLDDAVGIILDFIEEKQIGENTYIIYTSDNGGQLNTTNNEPLRLGKTILFEGGIRVPLIISGPGIAANTHSSKQVIGYDFYPTFIDLMEEDLTKLPEDLDGVSFKTILMGNEAGFTRDQSLIFHSPHYDNNANKEPRSAIIKGTDKLLVEYETGDRLHYDLATDIDEGSNIYSETGEISRNLLIELRDYLLSVEAQMPTFSTSGTDTDNDQLPDEWEFQNILGALYNGNDNPDGDGYSNLEEYNNNTDPLVFNIASPLAVDDIGLSISIFPNPTKDFVIISGLNNEPFQFNLFSLDGKFVLAQSGNMATTKIYLSEISKGIYLYSVSFLTNAQIVRGKLVIN